MDTEKAQPVVEKPARDTPLIVQCLAEFLGMLIFVLSGEVAKLYFFRGLTEITTPLQGMRIRFYYCCGMLFSAALFRNVSGAHLNPGVTIFMTASQGFPRHKVLPYIISQLLGAITGTVLACGLYRFGMLSLPMFQAGDPVLTMSDYLSTIEVDHYLLNVCLLEMLLNTMFGLMCKAAVYPLRADSSKPGHPVAFFVFYCIFYGPLPLSVLNGARGLGGAIGRTIALGGALSGNWYYIIFTTIINLLLPTLGGFMWQPPPQDPPQEDKSGYQEKCVRRKLGSKQSCPNMVQKDSKQHQIA